MGNRPLSVEIHPHPPQVFHKIHRLSHKIDVDFSFPQHPSSDPPVGKCGKRGFSTHTPHAAYPPFPPIPASRKSGGKRKILYSCRNSRKFRPIPRTHKTEPVEKQSKVPALRPVFQNPTVRTVRRFSSASPPNQCNFTKSHAVCAAISGYSRENFHFSTILPPLRLLRLRTNLYITLYKKNYRCAVLLLTRETRCFAEIAGNACGAPIDEESGCTFGKLQESPQDLQFRSQSVRHLRNLSRSHFLGR